MNLAARVVVGHFDGAGPGCGDVDLGIAAVDLVSKANTRQGFPFFAASRWPVGWAGVAVENRNQAAAGGAAALYGNAGGKAQSGNSSAICFAMALRRSTPARKLMTKMR